MTIAEFSIGEPALGQQGGTARRGKPPRSRQTVAKADATTLVPEAR